MAILEAEIKPSYSARNGGYIVLDDQGEGIFVVAFVLYHPFDICGGHRELKRYRSYTSAKREFERYVAQYNAELVKE